MTRVIINENGTKRYYDANGMLNREDGPAMICPDGKKYWYLLDELQYSNTLDGWLFSYIKPAISSHPSGYKFWSDGSRYTAWPKL